MKDIYKLKTSPKCRSESVVKGAFYRFTVLTPYLIRMEYSETAEFEDRATQSVLNRDFPVPEYKVIENEEELSVKYRRSTR